MWRDTPLIYIVLEKLRKINGTIRDEDLYKEIKKDVNYEFSFSDFLKALMALEIRGVISVSLIRENTRMVTYLGEKE
ncbi:hypothetical protein L3N51_01694 [Metallosphaera sp. J1]|uniref:hypothetical protein n=1 Tax=Metallosphaera TaxID=41980 RepID=UPI001EE0EF5B|nr:hypothetical protein [Metallosphaera javensis (ex Hofmann et al. 2022)]MCG3109403.1 hypothetical protein [Metallosphaera javensis (ex Hofmann et al. 2022)]BCS92189.1 MAG: hypothetical protein MjAS7_0797 [Metallosphaera javensis (ex Sakai et al. 2022)]